MKKNIFILNTLVLLLLCAFFTTACSNDDEVEIKYGVTVTISPKDVINSFTEYKAGNFDMNEDDELGKSKLRINAFIYNTGGDLVTSHSTLLGDYNQDFTFSAELPELEYTLVCFSSIIFGEIENPTLEAYTITDYNKLSTLTVTQNDHQSYNSSFSFLGKSESLIKPKEKTNYGIYLQPATALLYMNWYNIHSRDANTSSSSSIYGDYTATATDYWGENEYSWTISIEEYPDLDDCVLIKNLDPHSYNEGYTADNGYNTYIGIIFDNEILIPTEQYAGWKDDVDSIKLRSFDNANPAEAEYYESIFVLTYNNGSLTAEHAWGFGNEKGFYSLFNGGVTFTAKNIGEGGVDEYLYIFHNNNVIKYTDGVASYSTSLSQVNNNYISISTTNEEDSYYEFFNLLPCSNMEYFGRYFIGNEMTDYAEGAVTIEAGKQYAITYKCKDLTINIIDDTRSVYDCSEQQSLQKISREKPYQQMNKYLTNGLADKKLNRIRKN